MIPTNEHGQYVMSCGCKVGRLITVYCDNHIKTGVLPLPSGREQDIIRCLWLDWIAAFERTLTILAQANNSV